MDIAALSVIKSMAHIKQQAGIQVLKMAMDSSQENADFYTRMLAPVKQMEQSVSPHLGRYIDIRV